jgi:acetyl-CoA synthetase
VTTFCAPPTVWRMLIQEDLRAWPVRLREVASAGEPLNPEVIEQVQRAWGLTIRDGFGQTETTAQIGNPPGQPLKVGSMGRPLPGYRVALVAPDGTVGDEGEICLDLAARPAGLMTGYLDDAARTADVMRGGWYHTGDVARRDAEGYITYVGRTDDVFKSSDYRISPFEPARGAEGVRRARLGSRAGRGHRALDPRVRAEPRLALQAHPSPTIRGTAEDDLREDTASRTAAVGVGARRRARGRRVPRGRLQRERGLARARGTPGEGTAAVRPDGPRRARDRREPGDR